MLLEIILFTILGILAGTLTGLTPGIHINLIGSLLLGITSFYIDPLYGAIFVVAMAVTHTFVDFIPSIFLGCPDTDTELSILPGHYLLKNKRGYEAIELSNYGSLIAIFILILIVYPASKLLSISYPYIEKLIPYLLILVSIILIFTEKKKYESLLVFLLTGFLGYSLTFFEINQPLLPLLTGLFGASNLILSIRNKVEIGEQIISEPKINFKKPILGSFLAAPLCSLLPGMGSGEAAVIGGTLVKQTKEEFLVLIGITNTLIMTFSFVTLYLIGKTRTGAAAVVDSLIHDLEIKHLLLILSVVIFTSFVAFFLTKSIAKVAAKKLKKLNYTKVSIVTLIILAIVVFLVSGLIGLIALTISTIVGIYSINLKVRRTNMMGSLIVPTIIFYLF